MSSHIMRARFEGKVVYDKTNNSFSVTIPRGIASLLGLEPRDEIVVSIEKPE